MSSTEVLIPTMGRPHRIPALLENLADTAPDALAHFIIERDDEPTVRTLKRLPEWDFRVTAGTFGTYAKCINAGYQNSDADFLMTLDDDVVFHEGWLVEAMRKMGGGIYVVGTNDLHNPFVLMGEHSTHSLVDRVYLDEVGAVIDQGPGSFMYEYDHNYTDAELVETAKARGVFAPCLDSVVEHIHPDFGGREPDETWNKTRRAVQQDFQIFESRRHLWQPENMLEYSPPENR